MSRTWFIKYQKLFSEWSSSVPRRHLRERKLEDESKDDGEVPLVRTDIPETVIDVPSEEFDNQQLEVEYEKEFEDES